MITLAQYVGTMKDDYPEEWDDSVATNAQRLLACVERFFDVWGGDMLRLRSGYRPPSYNKKIGGAPNSYHCKGMAIDLADPQQQVAAFCLTNHYRLFDHGLWMESHLDTPGWTHLDIGERADRRIRIFKP